jgi:hypothetical protein
LHCAQSLQQNALFQPDKGVHQSKHHDHVDSCVPEYLRKSLAPELLDNRLRIQDMKFYQVGGAEYIVTGIDILVTAVCWTLRESTHVYTCSETRRS